MAGKLPKTLKRNADTRERAFGAVITELRLARRWGYEYVAHKVGCNQGYMNEMEHGKRNPTMKLIQAIADLHGLNLSRLIAKAERKYERALKERAAATATARSAEKSK